METVRLILFVILAFLLLQIWEAWRTDQQVQEPLAQSSPQELPQVDDYVADQPVLPAEALPPSQPELSSADLTTGKSTARASELVRVETDLLVVEIDTLGAVVRKARLKQYPVDQKNPLDYVTIMDDSVDKSHYLQSGVVSADNSRQVPNHNSFFTIEQADYRLGNGQQQLQLIATAEQPGGLLLTKKFTFSRGSYQIKITSELTNGQNEEWQGYFYHQLVRSPGSGAARSFFTPTSYEGAAYYSGEEKYQKSDYGDISEEPLSRPVKDGWIAMLEHYFVAALVPTSFNRFYTKALTDNRFAIGALGPVLRLQPGQKLADDVTLYIGPKEQKRLKPIAPGLELTIDFGMLTFLADPLFWLLAWLHGLFGNWGWAIIGVTVAIKAAFYPLSAVGYRSMAKMKNVQPKMVALREAYADDKALLNQKMMELYRNEKINPLGGCLPILVQIPVFIALYWVLLESVELRQAGFIFWLTDLSQADPYYVLPIIMGISMIVQQRMNPAQLDPIQQKVMMAMPVVFTFFFFLFPAGLVLYWVVNNILSIAQQWWITRKFATV
ncbi:MAG TPA: membrane protein insertase YidC [Gammaproteobacteria bacterium]|nr:membrane protein insertase YidC [Gammaproteobacteria bacterium]